MKNARLREVQRLAWGRLVGSGRSSVLMQICLMSKYTLNGWLVCELYLNTISKNIAVTNFSHKRSMFKINILWVATQWLIGKDLDWGQEEKGDEMVRWHHWLSRREFEQTLGDGEGQGSLVCYSSWGCKQSDMTEWLNNNAVTLFWSVLGQNYELALSCLILSGSQNLCEVGILWLFMSNRRTWNVQPETWLWVFEVCDIRSVLVVKAWFFPSSADTGNLSWALRDPQECK